jgi:tetratricopeptide (TPR) repeat protein
MRLYQQRREMRHWLVIGLLTGFPWMAWAQSTADEPESAASVTDESPTPPDDQTVGEEATGEESAVDAASEGSMAAEGETDSESTVPDEPADSAEPATESDTESTGEVGLKDVRPGQTTREALHVQWGQPERVEKIAGGVRELFSVGPFDRVRATIVEDVVQSLAIHVQKPAAVESLAALLDLNDVEPVEIFNDRGELLGLAYPERGVLFGFTPASHPPQVFQIIVEPVDVQSFLARAEARLPMRYADCLADLNRALELASDSGRAHWLHAELTLHVGDLQQALRSAQKAIELEAAEPEYRLTLAKVLAAVGDYPQAIQIVRKLAEGRKTAPIVAARAYCLWGNFVAAGEGRDHAQAIKHHTRAIQLAEPLAAAKTVAVRRAAKKLLLDAHLGVAHDIGWGRWQHKAKVVPKWIDRGSAVAEDIVATEQGSPAIRLQVCEQALAALAGISDPPEASLWLRGATELGKQLIEEATDSAYRAYVSWHLAEALCHGVEIEVATHHSDRALELGQLAMTYFELGETAGKQLPMHDYLRGRLNYRLGAIFALERSDHAQAVTWFDRAVPLLETPVPQYAAVNGGRQGETFISMAVSYWDVNNRPEALRLTKQGVKLMEKAAAEGLLSITALAIPYGNLASMHEQLGDAKQAKEFSELAARSEASKK